MNTDQRSTDNTANDNTTNSKTVRSETEQLLQKAASAGIDYLRTVTERGVAPTPEAITNLNDFHEALPLKGHDAIETLALLDRIGSPATTATTGGRFFGLVVGGALPVTVAANWLATAWDQVVFNQQTSAVGVELETITSRWVLELLGLPMTSSVGFVTGATMANFTCLSAARTELLTRLGHDVERAGLRNAPPLRIVASDQIHVTVRKSLSMLGLGTEHIETVPTDSEGRLILDELPQLDSSTIVILQAGNVSTGSFDPFAEVCQRARAADAWVHVDGAFGLWAAASPELAGLVKGMNQADSWATDTHKWLNTPYDCGLAICANPGPVHRAMASQAPYLNNDGSMPAPKDMVPEFSRRARAVEVWAALRFLGSEGVAELIDQHCRQARRLADGLSQSGFAILNDVVLNQVLATREDFAIDELAKLVQRSGECWFGPATWQGTRAVRISISSWATTDEDIERTIAALSAGLSGAQV